MEATTRVVVALERLKGVFLEIPGTQLSLTDAATISGLDNNMCRQLLAALVDVRFLTFTPAGAYRRRGPISQEDFSQEVFS
jgi:DNA-binding IclR family transcriptional regulator